MNNRNFKTYDELLNDLYGKLSYIKLSKEELKLIIDEYVDLKKSNILEGSVVSEYGLANYYLSSRGGTNKKRRKGPNNYFSIKIISDIDYNLKCSLMSEIKSREEFDDKIVSTSNSK